MTYPFFSAVGLTAKRMTTFAALLMASLAMMLVAGCTGIPQDGRYQTHDAGRSNNRA